ncbi:MAG: hypothetical protein OP8BY_1605 [Candidatus Saccharicenans subterraneus]|uniref:DUF429 domain-containing protein n=1 Tax=Candidatus Saccharicenans subterraneus TaxID=2508984 RepID=A0A3E2BP58_9BACT|nr:MAG: hypothetical protein OP8BY_1605 [Candidatus Saccharicenans subterraneum]
MRKADPLLVAIDAPLSLPPGRRDIEDRRGGHFRSCDLELRKRGIRFFPITLGPMRALTRRGLKLKSEFLRSGYEVIEIYPGGAQDIWGLPRAGQGREKLASGLERLSRKEFGLRLSRKAKPWPGMSADELDAVSAALVGLLYCQGRAELYGRGKKIIVMPAGRGQGSGRSVNKPGRSKS